MTTRAKAKVCKCGHGPQFHRERGRGIPAYCARCKSGKAAHSYDEETD